MQFLDEKRSGTKRRKLQTAFRANYTRFMNIDVASFPVPPNVTDEATTAPYLKDIAEIRSAPTLRLARKRKDRTEDNFIYDDGDNDDDNDQ